MPSVRVLPALALLPAVLAAQSPPDVAVQSITEADVFRHIAVLAHDSMEGRATPSPGLDRAARYVSGQFQRLGLTPGGDGGTFIQHYRLADRTLDRDARVVSGFGHRWALGREILHYDGETGPDGVTGPTIVLSGAFTQPEAIHHVPIEGAVVLLIAPMTPGGEFHPVIDDMLRVVQARHPAATFMVTRLSPGAWERRRQREVELLATTWDPPAAPVLYIQDETLGPALQEAGFDLAAARAAAARGVSATPVDLALTVTVAFAVRAEVVAPNVVGILPGSDPALAEEYVVFSAHMDHVGVGTPVDGDAIYNGADDDASGTAGVLELAEAFSRLTSRPRRSLIFLAVSGEERGLWGSDHFVANPPVPLEQIVANINMDMIGRNWPDTIAAIGLEHSDLGDRARRVSAAHPELDMAIVDDQWPEEGYYTRSDHYNFARRGVPILFFFSGPHEDYHEPSDHVEKIDAEKEARLLRLIFHLGLEVADADARPRWNPESSRAIRPGE